VRFFTKAFSASILFSFLNYDAVYRPGEYSATQPDFSATTTGIALSHFSPLTTSNYASNFSIFL